MSKSKGKQIAEPVEIEPAKEEPVITTGKGQFTLLDNSKYDGEWKEIAGIKYRDGKGVCTMGPEKFVGNWNMDAMNGYGEYFFSSGAVYRGNFNQNLFDGEGTYTFPDGSSYTGNWSQNKMHGVGTYKNSDDVLFEGDFFNGMFNSGRSYISLRGLKKS
mmetsp:Transcript_2586/g.3513  ORF Transcript_2586/g.3513 Transcript_2586/m.3513 type:complete len:159 (+) Transcript_2586:50-526(+)